METKKKELNNCQMPEPIKVTAWIPEEFKPKNYGTVWVKLENGEVVKASWGWFSGKWSSISAKGAIKEIKGIVTDWQPLVPKTMTKEFRFTANLMEKSANDETMFTSDTKYFFSSGYDPEFFDQIIKALEHFKKHPELLKKQ